MRIVELFSGCGGTSLGFQNAGFDIVAAYEIWDTAIQCYGMNFKHPVRKADLSDTDTVIPMIKADAPDIITGGPPCQDFSSAGKRIECDRADLTRSYSIIVDAVRPKFFVMENVDRSFKSDTYKEARKIFKDAGYGLTEQILNASHCGVPQSRKRFICVGMLGGPDDFMKEHIQKNMTERPLTLRQYFGNSLDFEYYYRHPRNYSRRAIFSIDEPAPTMRGVNRPVPKGYPGHPNDALPLDGSIRPLTTLERSLIQTFPHTFQWTGSKTDMEQMIGNAVPVKLAEFVAVALKDFIDSRGVKRKISDGERFASWLISEKEYKKRSANDVLSRLKRADGVCSLTEPDDRYVFDLEHTEKFATLSPAVRSQVRKAVRLYSEFHESSVDQKGGEEYWNTI